MDGGGEDASAKKKHKTSADRTIDYYHSLSLSLTYLRPVSPPPPPPPPPPPRILSRTSAAGGGCYRLPFEAETKAKHRRAPLFPPHPCADIMTMTNTVLWCTTTPAESALL